MPIKKTVKTAKGIVNMYKEFAEAWKGREDSYNKHMGITPKKKKKKK